MARFDGLVRVAATHIRPRPVRQSLRRLSAPSGKASLPFVHHAASCTRPFSSTYSPNTKVITVPVTYITADGEKIEVEGEVGKSLLDIAHDHDIDIEGACGGELACSTCHVILPQESMELLPDATEEEEDMLDLAWGVTPTSRLGCQIILKPELKNMIVRIPDDTVNLM